MITNCTLGVFFTNEYVAPQQAQQTATVLQLDQRQHQSSDAATKQQAELAH
jgi:hypothetical protein